MSLKIKMYFLVAVLMSLSYANAQTMIDEQHIRVSLRMIGHQILLYAGDSNSRVLPVEKETDYYKLHFEKEFEFEPEKLQTLIDSVVRITHIAGSYLVEVADCQSQAIVYSYKVGIDTRTDIIPCTHRMQPKACYYILFTILTDDASLRSSSALNVDPPETKTVHSARKGQTIFLLGIPFLLLIAWWRLFRKKEKKPQADSKLISIGAYQFDQHNMQLIYGNEKTELTAKEADLLYLLYTSANNILSREHILNSVWGDQGDYIGRTLDVFISKLRKKLKDDPAIKIINARGVGYKLLLLNEPER